MKQWIRSILPLVSALLLAGVVAAQSTEPAAGQQSPDQQNSATQSMDTGQQTSADQPQTLVDPGVIYNSKKAGTWVGKTVTLKNVVVEDTNKDGNFWVGSDGHHRLLIVKPTSNMELSSLRTHKGDVVTITGEIQPASVALAEKTGTEKGSMKDAENSSGVFLLANSLNIVSSTQH